MRHHVDRTADAVDDRRDVLEFALDRVRLAGPAGATAAAITSVHGVVAIEVRKHRSPAPMIRSHSVQQHQRWPGSALEAADRRPVF
jgi:hypothetical protein